MNERDEEWLLKEILETVQSIETYFARADEMNDNLSHMIKLLEKFKDEKSE